MDSPLTTAELSRLRKAIQQRDRLVVQGLATSGVDLRISSALSNLKLYLPAQTQLAVVFKDWETSDEAQRSQIIIWLRQNILNDTPSQASVSLPKALHAPVFTHPPPPPPLPSRTASIVSQPERPTSLSGTPPIPTSSQPTPVQAPSNANNAYPPREIHTRASLKPPTPPPKDRGSGIVHEPLTRRHTLAGRPQPSHQFSTLVDNPMNERYSGSPASSSLYPGTFAGHNLSQPNIASRNSSNATDSTRRFGTQTSQPTLSSQSHTPNSPAPLGHDSNQYQDTRIHKAHSSKECKEDPPSLYIQQLMNAWTKIQAQQAQQSVILMQQHNQGQQPPPSNNIPQLLAAAQQQQAQQQANFLQQLQAQQSTSVNNTTQLLATLQQQQQAQANQMISMLQQYQQNTPNFNPGQNFQDNQQLFDLLSQIQSGGAPGVDWGGLASGSGMDPSTLMNMVMGSMDPTNLAIQGAGFMFG
ncbi:hypothetical protein OPQ81_008970 [Rhizoctonia solani]|nr:hypothetical protein OPQ81_008970 [Rhizoctonia solani]